MHMNPAIDPKQLEVLIGSDVFKQAQAAADAKRMEAHRAAVDKLLAHESDVAEIDAARAAVDEARKKFEPVATSYRKASFALADKEENLRDLERSHEHTASRLRHAAARHLPAIVPTTEWALNFAAHEVRNSLTVQAVAERNWNGASRNRYESNAADVDAALVQVEKLRELLAEFALDPAPAESIRQRLATEAGRLIDLAKQCGAAVAHHLPAELRPGIYVEKPERQGPYIVPTQ
jgi:hypothetical protein